MERTDKTQRNVVGYARNMLFTPYKWAGNNPLEGFDCSGFLCEVLRAFGIVGQNEDFASRDLFAVLQARDGLLLRIPKTTDWPLATVLFFGESERHITHCALSISRWQMIEAAGGDRTTTTPSSAVPRGAMVRIRPIVVRNDLVAGVLPKYP